MYAFYIECKMIALFFKSTVWMGYVVAGKKGEPQEYNQPGNVNGAIGQWQMQLHCHGDRSEGRGDGVSSWGLGNAAL